MLTALREERSTLEQRVEERTIGLTRKTEQLRATSYIARKTAEVQDLATLLDTVARLVTDQFGFYHTGIFLINETGDQAVLQAASSDGGRRMIERGHSLSVGTQGIVGHVAAQKKPRIALDVGTDAVFFDNPDLPMTRSELALPLLVRGKVVGVLDIQSNQPQAFDMEDIDVLQTLSDQVAIAIENARLMDETQAAIVQLEALTSIRTREAWRQNSMTEVVSSHTHLSACGPKSYPIVTIKRLLLQLCCVVKRLGPFRSPEKATLRGAGWIRTWLRKWPTRLVSRLTTFAFSKKPPSEPNKNKW